MIEEKVYLYSLTLYQGLRVRQDSQHHVLYRTLFFENHPG